MSDGHCPLRTGYGAGAQIMEVVVVFKDMPQKPSAFMQAPVRITGLCRALTFRVRQVQFNRSLASTVREFCAATAVELRSIGYRIVNDN